MITSLYTKNLLDLSHTMSKPLLEKCLFPWEALPQISTFILELGKSLCTEEYDQPFENVWIAKSAHIYPCNYIEGPAIIGPETQVRPGAFIRGNALVGSNCVIGNSAELKNVILFDCVQVPHYNYVGDSILGFKAHMGAGSITSNVKQDKTPVTIAVPQAENIQTHLKKMGAILGDNVEIGCNSVLNPGCVIGKESRVYPLSAVRGFIPPHTIYKRAEEIIEIRD